MNPVSPVIKKFADREILLGEGQPQYFPIPTLVMDGEDKTFISRWEFTEEERKKISSGASLFFYQSTFGLPFQPVLMMVEEPE